MDIDFLNKKEGISLYQIKDLTLYSNLVKESNLENKYRQLDFKENEFFIELEGIGDSDKEFMYVNKLFDGNLQIKIIKFDLSFLTFDKNSKLLYGLNIIFDTKKLKIKSINAKNLKNTLTKSSKDKFAFIILMLTYLIKNFDNDLNYTKNKDMFKKTYSLKESEGSLEINDYNILEVSNKDSLNKAFEVYFENFDLKNELEFINYKPMLKEGIYLNYIFEDEIFMHFIEKDRYFLAKLYLKIDNRDFGVAIVEFKYDKINKEIVNIKNLHLEQDSAIKVFAEKNFLKELIINYQLINYYINNKNVKIINKKNTKNNSKIKSNNYNKNNKKIISLNAKIQYDYDKNEDDKRDYNRNTKTWERRGHWRKYRNDNGEVYKKVWISSTVCKAKELKDEKNKDLKNKKYRL